jgi:hypothetical protein
MSCNEAITLSTWQVVLNQVLNQDQFLQLLPCHDDLTRWVKFLGTQDTSVNKRLCFQRYQQLRHQDLIVIETIEAVRRRGLAATWFVNYQPSHRLIRLSYRHLHWKPQKERPSLNLSSQLVHPRILRFLKDWEDWMSLGEAFGDVALRELFFYHFCETPDQWTVQIPIDLYSSSSDSDAESEDATVDKLEHE